MGFSPAASGLNAHHSRRDWGNSLIAELIDKLMTFFPRKRNSIVIAQVTAGQLFKGPIRGDYCIEIIVWDAKTRRCLRGEADWSLLTHNKGRHSCLCATEEREKKILSLSVFGRKLELADVCACLCVYYLCSEGPHPSHRSSQGLHHTLCSYGYTHPGPGTRVHLPDTG